MILSYTFPAFLESIPSGEKIHSFRHDPARRWRPGLSIQHWKGSPRNPRGNPYKFWENTCTAVQEVKIWRDDFLFFMEIDNSPVGWWDDIDIIAHNDGLTLDEFINFFVPKPGDKWEGRLIHWTEKRY